MVINFFKNILKNSYCSQCQEFSNEDNTTNMYNNNLGWSLYLKHFDNYSAYFLYHDVLNKDISDLFTLNNNSIIELYSNELIKVKMEIITLNDEDNITLLVPIDDYTDFNNIINEVKDNTFCIKYKAYFIDIFDMKIL
jgi:hypothetical protein